MFPLMGLILQFIAQPYNSTQIVNTAVTSGATFTEETITVLLTMLTLLALSIQIARSYFIRILKKFTLRFAADIWWLIFVILRDASIFLIVFMGFLLYWPGIYQDFPIAVPFQPLAVDFFAMALVLMLVKDTDEMPLYNSLLTIFVAIGTMLYIFGTVFVTESAMQLANLPPTISSSLSNPWGYAYATFNSMTNAPLSIYTFYVGFSILGICGLIAIIYSFRGGIMNRVIEPKANPAIKTTQPPQQAPASPSEQKK